MGNLEPTAEGGLGGSRRLDEVVGAQEHEP
jgi:hypothetical protein